MTIAETLRLIAPEYATVSEDELNMWIELAKPFVSQKRFGGLYKQAVAYLAAHKMKMCGRGDTSLGTVGDSMRVASVSEGGISVSYNNGATGSSQDADSELLMTPYGIQFLHIRRHRVIPVAVSGEDAIL